MPSRDTSTAHPKFSFVTLGLDVERVDWRKTHSSTARSHAAYWGGPHKLQRENKAEFRGLDGIVTSSVSDVRDSRSFDNVRPDNGHTAARAIRCKKSGHSKKKAKAFTAQTRAGFGVPYLPRTDNLQYLYLRLSSTGIKDLFAADLSPFTFFGEDFFKDFVVAVHEDQPILFNGCLLLSYAHTMALTGRGTTTEFFELKGVVLRCINQRMTNGNSLLSLRCLIALLSLGAPIVCLVSQALPQGMTISEYINASTKDDGLCCREFAKSAELANGERRVYWQTIRRMLSASTAALGERDGLALFQYMSRYMNILSATENEDQLSPAQEDPVDLDQAVDLCAELSFPGEWSSPLTCQWYDGTPKTHPEAQMLLLTSITQRWLATFLDTKHCTMITLRNRAELRRRIEQFESKSQLTSVETEAMYESCRWASFILLSVEKFRIPISEAPHYVPDHPRVIAHLRKTDLSNLWGCRRGLLFWVITVCHFSSAGKCLPLLCTTVFARFFHELAMSEYYSEVAIRPLRRLKQFEVLCTGRQL